MSNLPFSAAILMIMVVITKEQILEDIPLGTPEQEAIEYFRDITGDDNIHYYTRENQIDGTVRHELRPGEAGYYLIGIHNARKHWWWPSFGRQLLVTVVISDEGSVSGVKFSGGRTGWP